jgi:hypothetical protein
MKTNTFLYSAILCLLLAACKMNVITKSQIEKPIACVDSFDFQQHSYAMYAQAEMKYTFSKNAKMNFSKWQTNFRTELKEKLGLAKIERQLKDYKPKAVRIDSEDLGYALRERWVIWTEPTVPLPFVLILPIGQKGKVPLMITPHGHSKNTESYTGIYLNEEDRIAGEEGERNVAVQAAKEGFIAIAPTARGFGATRTKQDIESDEMRSCHSLLLHDLLVGRTPIGDRVWDISKLIDWALENLPVDETNIFVSGNSGGGTATLFAGACDTRIAASIPSSYFNTFSGCIGTFRHCECNYVPGILDLGEMWDVAGLTAPRYFCAIHGVKDKGFPIENTRIAFKNLQEIYKVAGVPQNCELYEGSEGHRYYKKGAWDFIHKHIQKQ